MRHLALALAIVFTVSCGPGHVGPFLKPITDCAEQTGIDDLIASWITRRPPIGTIKDEAIDAGINLGGCAFAKYVDMLLTPKPGTAALPADQANEIRETFEDYRVKHANNTVFKYGDEAL